MFDDNEKNQIEESHKLGVKQASYLVGFGSAFKTLGFSEEVIEKIILTKMQLEYNQEIMRMQLESNENIAERQSEKMLEYLKEDGQWN
jgi:hypothetical protein